MIILQKKEKHENENSLNQVDAQLSLRASNEPCDFSRL